MKMMVGWIWDLNIEMKNLQWLMEKQDAVKIGLSPTGVQAHKNLITESDDLVAVRYLS